MHELSIAMSLVDQIAEEAFSRGVDIVAIHLRLGPLSGVVPEALLGAYELAREDSPLADARLVIVPTPITAWCSTCQCAQHIESPQRLCCPVCDRPTPDLRSGRELEVVALEVLDREPQTSGEPPHSASQNSLT